MESESTRGFYNERKNENRKSLWCWDETLDIKHNEKQIMVSYVYTGWIEEWIAGKATLCTKEHHIWTLPSANPFQLHLNLFRSKAFIWIKFTTFERRSVLF